MFSSSADCRSPPRFLTMADQIGWRYSVDLMKRFYHIGIYEVAVKLVELVQPEIVAVEIVVRGIVRISSKISEVFHQHEGIVELRLSEVTVFDN